MSDNKQSFWSSNINLNHSSLPKTVLQFQAANLAAITRNIVEADVRTVLKIDEEANGFMEVPKVTHCFDIIAPLLGHQKFTLFCISQTIGLEYPLSFFSNYWDSTKNCSCKDLEQFNGCLKEILSSSKTTELINYIIGQST